MKKAVLIDVGFITAMLISAQILTSSVSRAESATANATVTVAEACTMTATIDSAHSTIVNPGQYVDEIGQTTLKVVCNDAEGYAIYAVGNANNEYGNNKLLASLGGTLNPTYDIATGTATSGNTSNWAMKVNAVSGAYTPTIQNSFGSYHEVPNAYMKVAEYASNTDTSTGSSITSTYAAFVKPDQPAGNYNGKVKYTMVHPVSANSVAPQTTGAGQICYYPNGQNVEGTMGCQTVSASDTSITLLASNFSREGYGFAGWSKTYDYSDGTGFFGPQEDITFTAGEYTGDNSGLSLYAHWIKSAGNLQSFSCPNNTTMSIGSVTALTDQRDNETYAVAKLADGNCWMIENLRLESTNVDNSTGLLAEGYGTSSTYGNFSGLAVAESTNFSDTTAANSLYYSGTQEGTATINIGTLDGPGYRMPRYNNTNTSARTTNNPTTNNSAMYSYGNYYNWHAAIADLIYNDTLNQSTTGTSLCPNSWHLPTGGTITTTVNVTGDPTTWREFYNLGYTIMGSVANDSVAQADAYYDNNTTNANNDTATKAFRKYPNNFIYSGNYNNSSVVNQGKYGLYWSSTSYSYNLADYLYVSNSNVYPGTRYYNKSYARSIRCLRSS